jgi:c-di-GMP-binding flagellar brake protein YcgR
MPRRALHRVETTAAAVAATVFTRDRAARGQLLNISAGGCRVRLVPPVALALGGAAPIEVSLETSHGTIRCSAELTGLHVQSHGVELRLRFRTLSVEQRRALLSYLGDLVTCAAPVLSLKGRGQPHAPDPLSLTTGEGAGGEDHALSPS